MSIKISASYLKKRIEEKAFVFGVSDAVATLIGEYVVELLRQTSKQSTINNQQSKVTI
ncbi:MAG: hypothetical protein ABIH21_03570 [Patescibacteria group bacterium]